jgi:DNA-binding MarR family transcriptional regulator
VSGEQESQVQDRSAPIRELAELFDDVTMKSSVRLLIVISLSINRRMVFTDLLKLTGAGKGSLSNHLERLSIGGYIRLRVIPTLGGPRTIAEITQKGLDLYRKYLEIMEKIRGSTESPSRNK